LEEVNAMVTFVRTIQAMPGKIVDALAAAKEMAALVKRATGVDVATGASFGGSFSEIAWIADYDSVAHMEVASDKMLADADVRAAMKKFEHLLVPGASRDRIWRHV
jgi:hypothetical protein